MSEEYGCIYKHTNKIHEGWSYIGQTIYDIDTRWKNGKGYDKCLVFKAAIKKYGWENFEHEIIEDRIPIDKLDEREIFWIKFYHTYVGDPECCGYNMTIGGRVNRGRICSEYSKQKTSESLKGHVVSDYVKQRVSECSKGRKHTAEAIEKIRQSGIGRDTHPKKIQCAETGMVFESICKAAKYYNHGKQWIKNRLDNPEYFENDIHFVRVDEHD